MLPAIFARALREGLAGLSSSLSELPMNRFLGALRALVITAAASISLIAAAQVPAPPEIAARSYLLLDVTANQILAQKDLSLIHI